MILESSYLLSALVPVMESEERVGGELTAISPLFFPCGHQYLK